MPIVQTGTVNAVYNVTTAGDIYVTSEYSTISSPGMGVLFTGAASIDYILAGAIYASSNGIDISNANVSDNHNIVVEATGSLYAGFDGMDLNGDLIDVRILGSVIGTTDALELSGNNYGVTIAGFAQGGTDGIELRGDNSNITITGELHGNLRGIDASGAGNIYYNSGIITAESIGLDLRSDNHNFTNDGIVVAGLAVSATTNMTTIFNAGTMTGSTSGFLMTGDGNEFTNTGTLNGLADSISFVMSGADAMLHNSGEVNTGVQVFGAQSRIINEGAIRGDVAFDSVLRNEGDISGEVTGSGTVQTVANFGTIDSDVTLGAGNDVYRGGGFVDGAVRGDDGNDSLTGGDLDDSFFGGNNVDQLRGKWGNDTLKGGSGSDMLHGGKDNDVLDGGGGNDDLNGGRDDDVLIGGSGNDDFIFNRVAGDDVITDFVNGQDQIDLSAYGINPGDFATVVLPAVNNAGGSASFLDLSALGGSGSVLIEGLSFGQVDASDFIL